jgi:8-oxo-dGTP pyrophosphatase MutT (NUDIX family)
MNKTITFDFDNTIVMSHMDDSSEEVKFVFQEYNQQIIDLIEEHIQNQDSVFIVTSRIETKESMFPEDTIPKHLERLNLAGYFVPNRLYYTNSEPKLNTLRQLGSEMHYDDDVEEINLLKKSGMNVKSSLDFYPDVPIVAKTIIFDAEGKVLLLQRTDSGRKWDLPGGHIKDVEEERGFQGVKDGLVREVAEETGLLLPFQKFQEQLNHHWKGNNIEVYSFLSRLPHVEPEIDLNLQDFQENDNYIWANSADIDQYYDQCTELARKILDIMKENDHNLTEAQADRYTKHGKHRKMKMRLIGLGKNKSTGGGAYTERPSMERSKSAPAGFGALEEQEDKKKLKIRVKIRPKDDDLDEKKKKKRKKKKSRKKKRKSPSKRRGYGGYYPFTGLYDSGGSDGGGDGGGGGE